MASQKGPDGLPIVHDEAGDTPKWVSVLGGVLLCIGVLYATLSGTEIEGASPEAPAAEAVVE